MAVALGTPSPGGTCLSRATVPAQRSPRLGELMVAVGWVPGREEDHVVAVAKGHELQAPKPDHRGQRKWMFGVSHPEKWQKTDGGTQRLLPSGPTVVVRALGGPKPMSEFVLCVPNLDGDAKRIHEGFILVRAKEGPTSSVRGGEVLYFLAPKCLHRGYNL
jgi:hypothetical protein